MSWSQRLADYTTIVVGLVILVVLGERFFSGGSPEPLLPVQTHLDASVGVDFAAAEQTLVMVLQSDCPYCEQSLPFYRSLKSLPRESDDLQIVIVAPPGDHNIEAYREIIQPDAVVFVDPLGLPVTGTPTLLLVDRDGVIEAAWMGLLDQSREAEVLAAFG